MRHVLARIAFVLSLAAALSLPVFFPPAPAWSKTVDVTITPTGFSPAQVTIYKGDSIRWVNPTAQVEHLASGQNCVPDTSVPIFSDPIIGASSRLYPYGGEFIWGFSDLGTFHYFSDEPGRCAAGMVGSFTVLDRPYPDLNVTAANLVLAGGKHEFGRVDIRNGYDIILTGDTEIVVWGWGDADYPDSQAFKMRSSQSRIYCQHAADGDSGSSGADGDDDTGAGGGGGTGGNPGSNGCSLRMTVYGDFTQQYGYIDLAGKKGGKGGGGGAGGDGHSCDELECEGEGCTCVGGAGGKGGGGGSGAQGGRGGSFTLWAYGAATFAEQFLGGVIVDGGAGGNGGGAGQGGYGGASCGECEDTPRPGQNGTGGNGAPGGAAGRIEVHARQIGKGILSAKGGAGGGGGWVGELGQGGSPGAAASGGDGGEVALFVLGAVSADLSASLGGGAGGSGGGQENYSWDLRGDGQVVGASGAPGGRGGTFRLEAESFAGTADVAGGGGGGGGSGENIACYCDTGMSGETPTCAGKTCTGASGGSGSPGGSAGTVDLDLDAAATGATLTTVGGAGGGGGCGKGATATCVWVDNEGTLNDYFRCDREWLYTCGASGGAGVARPASVGLAPADALSVSLSVDKDAVQPGGTLSYLLSYKNRLTTGVELSLDLPEGVTLAGASRGASLDGNAVRWSLASGAANPGYLSVSAVVDPDIDQPVTLSALARVAASDGRTASAAAAVKVLVDVDKTLPPGVALGQDLDNPLVADPVNPAIGNWTFSKTFFRLRGRSLPVDFTIHHNSADVASQTALGRGWSHSLATRLTLAANGGGTRATLKWGHGREEYFQNTGAGFGPVDCVTQNRLSEAAGGGYELTLPHGTVYSFTGAGLLTAITDANGNAVAFTQGSDGPTRVVDTSGNVVDLTYASGRLTAVSAAGITVSVQYDGAGNPSRITDPRGNAYVPTHDAGHRVLVLTDRAGNAASTNVYDAEGRIVAQTDAAGGRTTYAYGETDAYGQREVTVTEPNGDVVVYRYDGAHNVVGVTDGEGRQAFFDYDAKGRRVGLVAKGGGRLGLSRDASGDLTGLTTRGGAAISMTRSARGRPTRVTAPGGVFADFGYDEKGNLTSLTDVLGKTTSLTRNAAGQVTQTSDPLAQRQTATLDAKGYVATLTSPNGDAVGYAYDALGRITAMTFSDGSSVGLSYDANGNTTERLDAGGVRTTYEYDAEDRLTAATLDPSGLNATVRMAYDARGLLVSLTGPQGQVTTFANDAKGQVTKIVDPDGVTVEQGYDRSGRLIWSRTGNQETLSYVYDADGNLVRVADALGATWTTDHDPDGRPVRTVDPLGAARTYAYDATGGLASLTDENGRVTTFTRDALGRVLSTRSPGGLETVFNHDGLGRLIGLTDPLGRTYGAAYDTRSLPVSRTYPDGTSEILAYDALGRQTALTTRRNKTYGYAYDQANRPITTTLPDGAGQVQVTYDAAGNPVTLTGPGGILSQVHDASGRLTSRTDPQGNTLAFGYTASGRLASVTYPGARTVTYGYDAAGRVATVADWLGNVTTQTYDAAGRVAATTMPGGAVKRYTHDAAGRLTGIRHEKGDGTLLLAVTLTRDAAGRIVSRVEDRGGFAPSPTALSATLGHAAQNRLASLSAGGQTTTYAYDADGTLSSKTAGGVTTTYALDAMGRLATITGSQTASFVYDPLGGRIAKTEAGTQTRYLTHAGRVYCALNAANAPQVYYVHLGAMAYRITAAGAVHVYHEDERGSVLALSDSGQNLVKSMAYGPYGALVGSTGTLDDPFGFLGTHGVMTDGTGLLYMKARYYDPAAMRFISEDPLGVAAGLNLYAYADDDPMNRMDPEGLEPEDTAVKIVDTMAKILGTADTFLHEEVKKHPTVSRVYAWADKELKHAHIQAICNKMGATTFKEKKYYKKVAGYINKIITTKPVAAKYVTKSAKFLPVVDVGITGLQIYLAKTNDERIQAVEEGILGQLPGGDVGLLIGGTINEIPGVQYHVTKFGRVFFVYPDSYDLVSKKWWQDFFDKNAATSARIDAKIAQLEKLGLLDLLAVESPYED